MTSRTPQDSAFHQPGPAQPLTVIDDVPETAMVVFAHPDDAEIGAGAVAGLWAKRGCEVTFVLCTDGGSGSNDPSMDSQRLVALRRKEQAAAAAVLGVARVEFLGFPDGGLEDDRAFRGAVVRMIRKYRPQTVFTHDPYRMKGFQHRDHRMTGIVTTDAVFPYARDHLHFSEQINEEGLKPHKTRRLLYWGADEPDVVFDITESVDLQVEALYKHESQVGGLKDSGRDAEGRVRTRAEESAVGQAFKYGATYRQLLARV
ncbi:MAG: PIG-L family deacetylase [SAR202 cluster bacterium]|nr:PIG-L family deacetylase [SAR202 cluster bacterium]